jgi:hypothetical protein
VAAIDPFVAGTELKFGKPGICLDGGDRVKNASDADTIHDDRFLLDDCGIRHWYSFLFSSLSVSAVYRQGLNGQREWTIRTGHLP